MGFSFDFDFSVWIVPLGPASLPAAVLRPGGHGYGVPLAMHRMNPECFEPHPSLIDILLREEPEDEVEEEDEEENDGGEDEDGDEGYSE